MFLRKLPVTSNASRASYKLIARARWWDKSKSKLLSYRKLSHSGRAKTGERILRTRGSLLRKINLTRIAYSFRLTYPLLVNTFSLVPFSNKILVLISLPSGGLAYLPSIERHSLFRAVHFIHPYSSPWVNRTWACLTLVGIIQQYRKVSNFELWPGRGIQYARSAGSWGRITSRDLKSRTAIAYLPSGVRKVVSVFSIVVPGRAAGINKRDLKNTRSGYWRSFGRKSIVRGVAMNPIDHPHGGRTKALRYPRTPWGKTTKMK